MLVGLINYVIGVLQKLRSSSDWIGLMSRLIRFLDGTNAEFSRPIDTSPATRVIRNYKNQKYIVFVDESFRSFFGFNNPNGYLCYAAVGIPEGEYEFLKRAVAKMFVEYEKLVVGDSGLSLKEFKYEEFCRIPLEERMILARKLSRILKSHGAFIVGFFTRTRGVIIERVRVNSLGQFSHVPEDHSEMYSTAAGEMQRQMQGVAQSKTIAAILRIPLAAMANFLEYFGCTFQMFCDPREAKEDKAVQNAIDWFVTDLFAKAAPEEAKLYLGMTNTKPSHEEIGLQIADLMAGEIRAFFEENPSFLTSQSTPKLITSGSREAAEWWESPLNIFQKLGALTEIPQSLKAALREVQTASCLPLYRHLFAAGLLSCYTDLGNPRHIEVFEGNFFDQTD